MHWQASGTRGEGIAICWQVTDHGRLTENRKMRRKKSPDWAGLARPRNIPIIRHQLKSGHLLAGRKNRADFPHSGRLVGVEEIGRFAAD